MSTEPTSAVWIGALSSVVAHAALAWWLLEKPLVTIRPLPPSAVSIDVAAPPPPPEPPDPPKPKPATSKPEIAARAPAPAPAPTRDSEPPPSPPDEAPLDLSGVTLTSEASTNGVTAPAGNGRAGVSTGSGKPARATRSAAITTAPPAPPPTVGAADLSERPKPPALDGVLASHYPPELRSRGVSGQAVVSARIEPDGRARSVSIASETAPGFGAACRQTLLGSRWSPPRDRGGRPVATLVSYTCRFRIDE